MEVIKIMIILIVITAISVGMLWVLAKNAYEEKELPPSPKFEPRKMTDLSKGTLGTDTVEPTEAPKKRHYRKNYKKKPIDGNKKPVGRPKKSE